MSPGIDAEGNIAQLCIALDRKIAEQGEQAQAAARADATYKSERAKRILRARADGEKSHAAAETVADADDHIGELRFRFLAAAAHVDSLNKAIAALRERIGFGRSLLANQRAADQLHAQFADRTASGS